MREIQHPLLVRRRAYLQRLSRSNAVFALLSAKAQFRLPLPRCTRLWFTVPPERISASLCQLLDILPPSPTPK
jgi:hypothetical protein